MSIGFYASLSEQEAKRSSVMLHVEDKTLEQLHKGLSSRTQDFPQLWQIVSDLYGDSVIPLENLDELHNEIVKALRSVFAQTQEYEIPIFLQALDAMCMTSKELGLTLYGFSD